MHFKYDIQILTGGHYLSLVILATAGVILALCISRPSTRLVAAGFILALLGRFAVELAPRTTIYEYAGDTLSHALIKFSPLFTISQYASLAGFLIGSSGLLWFALQVREALLQTLAEPPEW